MTKDIMRYYQNTYWKVSSRQKILQLLRAKSRYFLKGLFANVLFSNMGARTSDNAQNIFRVGIRIEDS